MAHVVREGGNWIQDAIKKPGSFKAAAKRAGKSVSAMAQAHKHDSGKLGARARLAITLSKMRKK
jgi:hypothetical protein